MLTVVTEEQFESFVRVQISGQFNMLEPRARELTGLSEEIFQAIRSQYAFLKEEYPGAVIRAGSWL